MSENKIEKARIFCKKVKELAKEYDLPFFIVTDGASATSNNGCEAVKNARDNHIKWELKNNFDPYEDWSNENYDANKKYSDNFDDVLEIVNSLNNEELNYICNGEFKESPYVKYRNVLFIENKPASFIEIYQLPNEHYNFIVLATKEEYRNKKCSSILLNKMFKEFVNHEEYKYMWRVAKNNKISLEFAKKNGFIIFNETANKYELIK